MPEALRSHRNKKGQNFLHVAAGRLNFWILKFAAERGLETLFSGTDEAGWSPCSLLEYHLSTRKLGEQPPGPKNLTDACLPSWCSLGALQLPEPNSKPAFADVILEVEDEHRGNVKVHAHRVILAACCPAWHKAMIAVSS